MDVRYKVQSNVGSLQGVSNVGSRKDLVNGILPFHDCSMFVFFEQRSVAVG